MWNKRLDRRAKWVANPIPTPIGFRDIPALAVNLTRSDGKVIRTCYSYVASPYGVDELAAAMLTQQEMVAELNQARDLHFRRIDSDHNR